MAYAAETERMTSSSSDQHASAHDAGPFPAGSAMAAAGDGTVLPGAHNRHPMPDSPQMLHGELASPLRVAGLFAGIGGLELGLAASGHETALLCEIDPAAQRVLQARMAEVPLHGDITTLDELPSVDLVAAGFPCQNLSQAGRTAGIGGSQSGLVEHVFRLLDSASHEPTWLLLENVPFMLQLDRGQAMTHLTGELSRRGYTWAYRVVDTRAFGLPQRRQRVILLASRTHDPRPVLFGEEVQPVDRETGPGSACGFYWTEGLRGIGWAVDGVPTLKGGSTIGIPSPPGIWLRGAAPGSAIVTPDIRDAERLQGFEADWTAVAVDDPARRNGPRWKLVGNAVSVPVARWVGRRLRAHHASWDGPSTPRRDGRWPIAAWGTDALGHEVPTTTWPRAEQYQPLQEFLQYPVTPLSERAAAGFLSRARRSSLRFRPGFIEAIEDHLTAVRGGRISDAA